MKIIDKEKGSWKQIIASITSSWYKTFINWKNLPEVLKLWNMLDSLQVPLDSAQKLVKCYLATAILYQDLQEHPGYHRL